MAGSLRRACLFVALWLGLGASALGDTITVQQSTTSRKLVFLLVLLTDHVTGATGLTPTVYLSKNGAAGAVPAGTVTEVDATKFPGVYALTPTSADTGTLGSLMLHASGTGTDPADREYNVVAFNPDDGAALGLSRIDAAISSRSVYAGADTSGTTMLLTRIPGLVPAAGSNEYVSLTRLFGILTSTPAFTSGAFVNFPNVTVGGYASGQDPATLLQAMVVDGMLTFKQLKSIEAGIALDGDRTFNSTSHIAVLTYYRRASGGVAPDRTKPLLTKTTTYDSSNTQVLSQVVTLSNLP